MNTKFKSESNFPLSSLWIMVNQLNEKFNWSSVLYSPYPQDGKSDIYETVFLFDKLCKLSKEETDQSKFLDQLTKEIKEITKDREISEIKNSSWMNPEEFELRERCRAILIKAHKEAPLLN